MKFLTKNRTLSLLTCAILSFSTVLGGCSGGGEGTPNEPASSAPPAPASSAAPAPSEAAAPAAEVELGKIHRVSDETLSFKFWAAYNPTFQGDWENMKCWNYLEEATGVHLDWELYTIDEMKEKLSILLAAADTSALPDAFFRCNIKDAQLKRYGPEGLFIDIYDLVQRYAPNLRQRLDDMDGWSSLCDPETGAMYSAPFVKESLSSRMLPKLFLNKKMMEAVGEDPANTPKTTEELYDLLVKIRDNDANGNGDPSDEVGITSNSATRIFQMFMGAFGIDNRGRDDPAVDADPSDETKVRYVYTCDDYRKMLSYIHRLYSEGLIDPDLFSLKTSSMVALGSQDQIFGLSYHVLESAGVDPEDYTYLQTSLTGPDGHNDWNTLDFGLVQGCFVISSTCQNPQALVEWIDNLYTEEGTLLLYFGKEGTDFYYNDEGLPTYSEELMAQVNNDNPYDKVVSTITCYASGNIPAWQGDIISPAAQCRGISLEATTPLIPFANKKAWLFNFTTSETEELTALKADIVTNCHDVYRAKFVTGELDIDDDSAWNNYVQEAQSLGLQDMMDIYQTALDRMLA